MYTVITRDTNDLNKTTVIIVTVKKRFREQEFSQS
jgi:hypothetical protein